MEITRHFTSTVLIVNHDRILLHQHKKFGVLVPVGGHIDRDELPEEAAVREAKEEAGVEITLYNPDTAIFPDKRLLVRPMHVLLIDVNQFHQHVDFLFYASSKSDKLAPADGESERLFWLTRQEVLTAEMPENVRILALEALDLLGEE